MKPPPPDPHSEYGDWWPYENHLQFKTAELLFTHEQIPADKIDNGDNDSDDDVAINGPNVLADIKLTKTVGKCCNY